MTALVRWFVFTAFSLLILQWNSVFAEEKLDFNRDVRAILSDNCFLCHGPDETTREADLRLDTAEGALKDLGGYFAIRPHQPDESELIARILSDDESLLMPPPDSGKELTESEKQTLQQWIKQGAEYATHWAFLAPQRPELPQVDSERWSRNPIDRLIYDRLIQEGLTPSEPADDATILRRTYLDLIGLPPTLEQANKYLARPSGEAYQEVVHELLDSPHYGERWGRLWLDAARYADSDGYEKDKQRYVWFWRDWVINSFNQDKPYDQFLIEQIAGDLLPNATQDQRVATGYLRNSMINEEGGIDPEQFRVEAMFDRMDAIGKSILGITTQCAQCHTHKYDPLTHEEYYGMYAFLNNAFESTISVYTPEQQEVIDLINQQISSIKHDMQKGIPDWKARILKWESELKNHLPQWHVIPVTKIPFEGQKYYRLKDESILVQGFAPVKAQPTYEVRMVDQEITAIRMELLNDYRLPRQGPGRSIYGTAALSELVVKHTFSQQDQSSKTETIKFNQAYADVEIPRRPVKPAFFDFRQKPADHRVVGPAQFAIDGDQKTAWSFDNGPSTRNVPHQIIFQLEQPLTVNEQDTVSINPKQLHGGSNSDDNQNCNLGRFRLSYTTDAISKLAALPPTILDIFDIPESQRNEQDWEELFDCWRATQPELEKQNQQISVLLSFHPEGTTQLVNLERPQPRQTHLFERGNFLKKAQLVQPHVPAFLHPLPENAPQDRLTFARWLADRKSPTTARTIINRIWQTYFGTGFVSSVEDLGSQCEPPSHPKLFDWLSVELMDSGWSLKHIHKLIVNSETYRQSSHVTPQRYEIDPYNRLLARGPRFRMEAESVRDIALTVSQLLNPDIGGPSFYPPAPGFLFQPPASYGPKPWLLDTGNERFRRSLYIHTYRSVPYPVMQNFDAPKGDAACVRRVRSNTPLQALTLLNQEQFLEAAQGLAWHILSQNINQDRERLRFAFRTCLTREPKPEELTRLENYLDAQSLSISQKQIDSDKLLPAGREFLVSSKEITDEEFAAWTLVSRVLLNLDETITKQ